MAGKYKIVCEQGATLLRTLLIQAQGPPLSAWPLTGYDARMQVRSSAESSTVVLELSVANGRLTIGEEPGQLLLEVAAADTAALPPGFYRYDLELESPDGIVSRLLEGGFSVRAEVTR